LQIGNLHLQCNEPNIKEVALIPSIEEIKEWRQNGAKPGEEFVENVIVDPNNPRIQTLRRVIRDLENKYPDMEFRFVKHHIVWSGGLIFDSKNFARFKGIPDGSGLAVYAKPLDYVGQENWGPYASERLIIEYIRIPVAKIIGDKGWEEKVVKKAMKLCGDSWQEDLFAERDNIEMLMQ